MMRSIINNHKFIKAGLIFLFWLCLWQLAAILVAQELLIPSPWAVARRLCTLVARGSFWLSVLFSLCRIGLGFLLGVFLGAVLGALTGKFPVAHLFLSPLLNIIKATPVASFIVLALVWMKTGYVPVFISLLMVLPIVWNNVLEGYREVDKNLLQVMQVYEIRGWRRLRLLYIPSIKPYFIAACTTSMGLAWKAGIAAEVLSMPKNSLGELIYRAKIYLESPDLYAVTLVVIVLSVLLEKGFVHLLKRMGDKL